MLERSDEATDAPRLSSMAKGRKRVMEQRRYQGNIPAEGLADFLVQRYSGERHTVAQKVGRSDSFIVQIGRARRRRVAPSVTIGIARPEGGDPLVTLGEQQWMTEDVASHAVVTGLVGALITPWALWGLIRPAVDLLGGQFLPDALWNAVDTYVVSMGGTFAGAQNLARLPAPGPRGDGEPTRRLTETPVG
jgi:hypothetical protein